MFAIKYICALLLWASTSEAASGDRLTVAVPDGSLSGVEAETDETHVPFWAFMGIPYAAPPTGNLRFQPPQPPKAWSGVRDASQEGSMCTQNSNPVQGTEDCLFLNVFTTIKPINQTANSSLMPVLVWIHGGGFITGSGNLGLHGADRFLENGVIVASINYRLGVFGFLCTRDTAAPGNYGLKDQIFALKWIKNNIAKFGGNPNMITIFGESAGAASVHYLLQTNLTNGLFRGAISDSGSTLDSWSQNRHARNLAYQVGLLNLIVALDSNTLVSRLRSVPYKNLQTTSSQIFFNIDAWNGLPWSPCIESNTAGAVVTSYSYVTLESGNFVKVPILTGFNSNEVRSAGQIKWLQVLYSVQFSLFPETLVPQDMNAQDRSGAGSQIQAYYFDNQPVVNDTKFIHYASDTLFVRAARKTVQLTSQYVPVYFYRFSFTGSVAHESFNPEGVSHAEELQFLFNLPQWKQNSTAAKLTQTRMVRMWTNFVKTLNPTPYLDAVINATWPLANQGNDDVYYLDIGNNLVPSVNPQNQDMQFWENLYQTYGFEPYSTY